MDREEPLEAPCIFCGYNSYGYYQKGTHGENCPWHSIGGKDEREKSLSEFMVKPNIYYKIKQTIMYWIYRFKTRNAPPPF